MTQRVYDFLAPVYDLLSVSERSFRHRGLNLLNLAPSDTVLEIGCGTGYDLAIASLRTRQAVGIDRSRGMLKCAHQRLRGENLVQADATAIPYPTGYFDALYLFFTLELFPPPVMARVLSECHRVLVRSGRLAVTSLYLPDRPGMAVRIYQWCYHYLPSLVDCAPIRAGEALEQAGFIIHARERGSLWNLPVEIVVCHS